MKLAVENSSKRWNYVEAVLRDWVDMGYQTLDDVQAARLANKHQTKHQSMKKTTRQELLHDWFNNRVQGKAHVHNPSFEEKKRLFEERLKQSREDIVKQMLVTKPAPLSCVIQEY